MHVFHGLEEGPGNSRADFFQFKLEPFLEVSDFMRFEREVGKFVHGDILTVTYFVMVIA